MMQLEPDDLPSPEHRAMHRLRVRRTVVLIVVAIVYVVGSWIAFATLPARDIEWASSVPVLLCFFVAMPLAAGILSAVTLLDTPRPHPVGYLCLLAACAWSAWSVLKEFWAIVIGA